MPDGSCISKEQLTQRVEDEKKKKAEEERRAKEAKEAGELAKKEKLRIAQEEAQKKAEAERATARQAEAQKRAEAEAKRKADLEAREKVEAAKRAAIEAEAKRKADELAAARALKQQQEAERLQKQQDAKADKELEGIARDPEQTPASRAIAAIALGKDPTSFGIPNLGQPRNSTLGPLSKAEHEIAMIALGRSEKATASSSQASTSAQGKLRAVLEDPQQSAVSREIAAIALGQSARSQLSIAGSQVAPSAPASGAPTARTATASGSAVNGLAGLANSGVSARVDSVGAPAQQGAIWGSLNGAASARALSPSSDAKAVVLQPLNTSSTFARSSGSATQILSAVGKAQQAGDALTNFYMAKPLGKTMVDTAAEAGSTLAPNGLGLLGKANDGMQAYALYKKGDYLGLAQFTVEKGTVLDGEFLGARIGTVVGTGMGVGPVAGARVGTAIGGSATQFALDIGTQYVAPALGNTMYNLDPSLFTPK